MHPALVRRLFVLCLGACLATADFAMADTKDPVEALIVNSKLAMRSDPEVSMRDAEAALDLLKQNPNADQEVRARIQLCDYYSERTRAKAEQQAALMSALMMSIQRKGLAAGLLVCQGQISETQANFTDALNLYTQAVAIARKNDDGEMLAESLFQRGYVFGLQGQYANGLADLQEAQMLFEKVGLPHSAMTALSSVATLYNRLGDYDQALHIYQRALAVQHKNNMQREELVTTYNMGSVEEHLEHWDKARDRFNAALQLGEQLNYARAQAYALRGLAMVANSTDHPQDALALLDKASQLQLEVPDSRLKAQILLARGTALRQLSRTAESITALEDAKRIFAQADSVNELSNVYTQLALAYAQANNWRKAYEVRTEGQRLSENMLHNQLDQRFATLKIEFDTANKEKENALLIRENTANQKALEHANTAHKLQTAVITLSAILLILLGTMVWHQRRGKHHMHNLAMTDELTGVPNRRSVLTKLAHLLEKSNTRACAMLIIDIDHFKSINDRYGHPIGDEIIKATADRLRVSVSEPGFAGRLGGEEFVLILPDHSADLALTIAETLRTKIAELDLSRWLGDRNITISIGMTMTISGDTASTMLGRADSALYAAKHAGRNCVRCEPPLEVVEKEDESINAEIVADSLTTIASVP